MIIRTFTSLLKLNINAIALWPFVLVQCSDFRKDKVLINHEKIHLRQQIELLIIFFYIWYIFEYFYHLIRLKNKYAAYRAISFEKEAYENETNKKYLKNRPFFAFIKYI